VIEVMAQENTDMDSCVVVVCYLKGFTMWDYDHGLYSRILYFERNCWPFKRMAAHLCSAPRIFVTVYNSILIGMLSKHVRHRRLVHDVPESQLLDVLSGYGIHEEMLPTKMGGTVQLDQTEWIANRRAAELKEI
jgi:CRAL/TRIO domain